MGKGAFVVASPGHRSVRCFWCMETMRVPCDGEAALLLPEGAKPYWRGHVVEIDYELAS